MLKALGLVIAVDLLRNHQNMLKQYKDNKDELLDDIAKGAIVLNTPSMQSRIESRFNRLFENYFIGGYSASKALVDAEVAKTANVLKVPWKYNRDVIDLINESSVFKGYADDLYREGFKRGEIDRLKRVLVSATYENADEKVLARELQKSFNLTKKRSMLLARMETKRLRETTKSIYYSQQEVQDKYELVWDAKNDEAVRPSHLAMDGKVADSNGYFQSMDFGLVMSPPLAYNCRCSTYFRNK